MNNYTLIGHPLGHSMSPFIHEGLFKLKNRDCTYNLTDIAPENLVKSIDLIKKFDGFNITIPHKENIIPMLNELSESAVRYNSVNCVKNIDGKLIGYNTDCDGFLLSVKNMPLDKKVLLLGCGGAGRMMAIETVIHNGNLTIAIRPSSIKKAELLKAEILNKYPNSQVSIVDIDNIHGSFDLLLNSTPVGMFPNSNDCPVKDEVISNCSYAFDAIYNPIETVLMKKFHEQGKIAIGGASMLVCQAVKAHEIWNNDFYTSDEVNSIIKAVENKI